MKKLLLKVQLNKRVFLLNQSKFLITFKKGGKRITDVFIYKIILQT